MGTSWLLNTAWMLRCMPEARRFHRDMAQVAAAQGAVLGELLRANQNTVYGTRYGFGGIGTPQEFQRQVPLVDFDDIAGEVGQIGEGLSGVLTRESVSLLEPTSGSSGGRKLIPYTQGLGHQFQRAIAPWIADLFAHRPAVRAGKAYWSISPALGPEERSPGGIPIGFAEDTAYLGVAERFAAKHVLAVPASVAKMESVEAARYTTLLHLLRTGDLSLISVWSPTFLTTLLALLEPWRDALIRDLEGGTDSGPPDTESGPARSMVATPLSRLHRVRDVLRASDSLPEKLYGLWPGLALVSCWADGSAAAYLPALKAMLPWVERQPKGLLATEGCVSFPLVDRPGGALAIRSHFFEFIPESEGRSDNPSCLLAHQLEAGARYEVVLTTAGGLYRYRLGDIVEMVGCVNECPLLSFLGRSGGVSDLVGEKLHEIHVRESVEATMSRCDVKSTFRLLAPVEGSPPHYRLYIQCDALHEGGTAAIARLLEEGLSENPYYGHAVQAGQLGPVDLGVLPIGGDVAWNAFEGECRGRGMRAGDIKPVALDSWTGWEGVFSDLTGNS